MIRTDLAIEKGNLGEKILWEEKDGGVRVYKSTGQENNITVAFPDLNTLTDSDPLIIEIKNTLNLLRSNLKNFLIVGLGNDEITPDAIGPATASRILATRHIMGEFAENIGLHGLREVSVICPNVLGKTGIEASEMVKSLVEKIKPDAVIVIDALASSSPERLFKTVQFTDKGISPGSGVKNSRKELSRQVLGVPTFAIGVPTVMDISSITGSEMIVTPKDVDILTEKITDILSKSLNIFLQPEIEPEVILSLV